MPAPDGNKYNEKYTLKKELPIFNKIIAKAKKGKFLSIQEAVMLSPYSRQIFYYLCERFEDLDNLKKELNDIIIAIINRKGLEGDYNATSSIWRMKMLGETEIKDENEDSKNKPQEVNINVCLNQDQRTNE